MFKPVAAHEVPDVWEFVETGLQKILERCGTHTFTTRDIKRHLFQGRASLFVRDEGFVILEKCQEALSGEPYLNVWLMWFKSGEAKKIKPELVSWLDAVRDHYRCMWWEFGSPREEWGAVIDDVATRHITTWRRYR